MGSNPIIPVSPNGSHPKQAFQGKVKLSVLKDIVERGRNEIADSLDMAVEDVVDIEVAWELYPPEQIMQNMWFVIWYGVTVEMDWCGGILNVRDSWVRPGDVEVVA